jgi:hypothetical protein
LEQTPLYEVVTTIYNKRRPIDLAKAPIDFGETPIDLSEPPAGVGDSHLGRGKHLFVLRCTLGPRRQ